jgi:hypothetical protein
VDEEDREDAEAVEEAGKERASLLQRIEHNWIEIAAAALMALATIFSAYCAYESSLWHSKEALHYNMSEQAKIDAAELDDKADQDRDIDIQMATNYLNALAEGKPDLAEYYASTTFSPTLKAAIKAWREAQAAGNAPTTPFGMSQYLLKAEVESRAKQKLARFESSKALTASSHANSYLLLTVIFASVLFFAGISTKFNSKGLKLVVLAMGSGVFIVAALLTAAGP